MTISELKTKILSKGWLFRFISPNPLKKNKFGWKTLEQAEKEYGGFDSYLKNIAESQNLKELNIDTKAKNGNGFIKKGLFLVNTVPVENIGNVEVEKKVEPIKPIISNVPVENTVIHEVTKPKVIENAPIQYTPTPQKMEDLKTHIENAKMSERIALLEKDNNRLSETNKKLDHKNEELFSEVMRLNREKSSAGTLTELELQKKEIEHQRALMNLEKDAKGGLSGIMDEIKGNPELLGTIISVFQPNNPIVKAQADKLRGEGGGGSNDPSLSGNMHEDPETQKFIKEIYDLLVDQPREEVGKIGAIVGILTAHHEKIQPVLNSLGKKGGMNTDNIPDATNLDEDED